MQQYKRTKKSTVQLTSLLDLLFVMIFVSLIQQKDIKKVAEPVAKAKPKVQEKIETPAKPVPAPTRFAVRASFKFYGTSNNPNIPEGEYIMNGSYDKKSGKLHLGGVQWVNRPQNYDMVPLSGRIDTSEKSFVGRIEFQGCQKFTLTRMSSEGPTPISGTWRGVYDCSQGETGLTLTVR